MGRWLSWRRVLGDCSAQILTSLGLFLAPPPRETNRGEFIQELLLIWDASLTLYPELADEHAIAVHWLTHTWMTEELADPPSAARLCPTSGGDRDLNKK